MMHFKLLLDLLCQMSIFLLASAGWTLTPGRESTFRDREHAAHHHYWKFMLVLFDELIVHRWSREKMLTTFFRISRSCWTRSNSCLRWRFSSSTTVRCPFPGKASFPCSANSLRQV